MSRISCIHWRTATVLGVRIKVARCKVAIVVMPTMVFPAPQAGQPRRYLHWELPRVKG
ncbi:hypothetical protein [Dictyobacter formicarum]|uniref:hypothetical protein n=1 Tax=Dictyobacter formicarum TaxID=2778368 RepID=UPI00191663C8|nr:hypothetical protein [Dictyobacter formicarum]